MEKMDLKGIERKAYTSYHQDGLIDITVGLSIVGIGVSLIFLRMWQAVNIVMMVGILVAVGGPFAYAAAKRAYTVPRIGFVKFPQHRFRLALVALVGLFSFTAVLAGMAFILSDAPGWLPFAPIGQNSRLVIGVSIAALFGLIGYTFRAKRMYVYALVTLPIFATGHFLDYPLIYLVIPLGALILIVGSVTLFRFVRKYPLPAAGSSGN